MKYRKYTCILKRYNPKTNINSHFIALLDNPPENKDYKSTILDDYGRIKIKISNIWQETYLSCLESNCNIGCNLVESEVDGEIYSIDI